MTLPLKPLVHKNLSLKALLIGIAQLEGKRKQNMRSVTVTKG